MKLKIVKIGTSKGVVLPKKVLDDLNLNLGDQIEVKINKPKKARDGWKEKFEDYGNLRLTYSVEYEVTYPSGEIMKDSKLINLPVDLKQEELITLAEEEILKSYYLDVDIKITKLGNDEI